MRASRSITWRGVAIGGGVTAALLIGAAVLFKDPLMIRLYAFMHAGAHMHGANGMGHDEVNMPGLRGANATPEESAELAVMFRNFETITREVTNMPDGIRTVTVSSDDDVMAALVSHVVVMIDRVERGDDPEILIQSPTLDIFFARGDSIQTEIDVTDEGIVVVQTSNDPEVVAALHLHATEVTDMADRGMEAVHEAMMRRN